MERKLSSSRNLASTNQDVTYDGLGNITRKTDVGEYTSGPHAVTNAGGAAYTYDHNGNMVSGDGRTHFHYGPNGNRYQRIDYQGARTVTTDYLGNVERIHVEGSNTFTWRKTVAGVLYTLTTDVDHNLQGAPARSFIYTDHLGSTDVITDHLAQVVESQSFDAWGQRRDSTNWAQLTTAQLLGFTSRTPRGYTGHEQLDSLGLIHMNGRIYDPKLARFLQADPFIQAATHTQSYNRYSYLWNNPLNATDPSGFFLKKLWNEIRPFVGAVVGIALIYFTSGAGTSWFMQSWYGAASAGAIAGGAGAAANGGNILRGALTGAVSGAAFYGIGASMSGTDAIVGHATAGGLISLAQGGKFGHGFASAGLTKAFNVNSIRPMDASAAADAMRTAVAALSGGTISAITGGKFANGATTAALAQAVNGNNDLKRRIAAQKGGSPLLDTLTDYDTHLDRLKAGTSAVVQTLGGVGQNMLAVLTGWTPLGAFLGMHGTSNMAGGIGDYLDIFDGGNRDWNIVRKGYENGAEALSLDRSTGALIHAGVGLSTAGYGLARSVTVTKYQGSALEHSARVRAFSQAGAVELTNEGFQAGYTIYEQTR